MGIIEDVLRMFSMMEKLPHLTEAEKQMIREKMKTLPALGDGISEVWSKLGKKQKLSEQDLQSIYDVLRSSGAGKVAPFNDLIRSLDLPIENVNLSPDELYQWGVELCCMSPRVPGTTLMDDTAKYISEALHSLGIETWSEPCNFNGVFFHEWSFDIVSPLERKLACFPENGVGFGDVTAPLVDVGYGSEADYVGKDVKGKIVLVDWGGFWENEGPCALGERYPLLQHFDRAFANGVAGMVGYMDATPGNTFQLLESGRKITGGSNVWGQAEIGLSHQCQLPVVCIGREDALAIKKLLGEQEVKAHLIVNGVRKVSTTQIIFGFLPGRTNTTVACGGHYCTAFEGGVSGTISVVGNLAIAKYFASRPIEEREKSMLFFFDPFHVWFNCPQTSNLLLSRHKTIASHIEALVWLGPSGDGQADTPRWVETSDNPVLWPLVALAMAKWGIEPAPMPISTIWSFCATGAFERQGIPTMTMLALGDNVLTPEDTWDKFDPAILYRDVMMHIELAYALQSVVLPPYDAPRILVGGCGSLFTDTAMPEYPTGEQYVPEPPYPLIIGGEHMPVTILKTIAEKRAVVGKKHQ